MYILYYMGFTETSVSRSLKNYFFTSSYSKSNFNARQFVSKSGTKYYFGPEVKSSLSR
jgi:hypothetical protein